MAEATIPISALIAAYKFLDAAAKEKSKERFATYLLDVARKSLAVAHLFSTSNPLDNPAAGMILLENARACLILERYIERQDWLNMQKNQSILSTIANIPNRILLTFQTRRPVASVDAETYQEYGLQEKAAKEEPAKIINRATEAILRIGMELVERVIKSKIFKEYKLKDHAISANTERRYLGIQEARESLSRVQKHLRTYEKLKGSDPGLAAFTQLYEDWGGTPESLSMGTAKDVKESELALDAIADAVGRGFEALKELIDDYINGAIYRDIEVYE